jgi:hypothetical protein
MDPGPFTPMNLSFRSVATLSALIFGALALAWVFAPGALLSSWGVDLSNSAGLVGRRGAALYAGMGIMFFSARNTQPSPARSALLRGAVVTCLLLAVLGTYEFVNGHAGSGILAPIAIDIALAMAFMYVARIQQSSP